MKNISAIQKFNLLQTTENYSLFEKSLLKIVEHFKALIYEIFELFFGLFADNIFKFIFGPTRSKIKNKAAKNI